MARAVGAEHGRGRSGLHYYFFSLFFFEGSEFFEDSKESSDFLERSDFAELSDFEDSSDLDLLSFWGAESPFEEDEAEPAEDFLA